MHFYLLKLWNFKHQLNGIFRIFPPPHSNMPWEGGLGETWEKRFHGQFSFLWKLLPSKQWTQLSPPFPFAQSPVHLSITRTRVEVHCGVVPALTKRKRYHHSSYQRKASALMHFYLLKLWNFKHQLNGIFRIFPITCNWQFSGHNRDALVCTRWGNCFAAVMIFDLWYSFNRLHACIMRPLFSYLRQLLKAAQRPCFCICLIVLRRW